MQTEEERTIRTPCVSMLLGSFLRFGVLCCVRFDELQHALTTRRSEMHKMVCDKVSVSTDRANDLLALMLGVQESAERLRQQIDDSKEQDEFDTVESSKAI